LRFEANDQKMINNIQKTFKSWLENNNIYTDNF